jgi:hypothetical protein
MRFDGVAEGLVGEDVVPVLAPHLFPLNEPTLFQILDDALNSSLRDADLEGDLPKYQLRIRMEYR